MCLPAPLMTQALLTGYKGTVAHVLELIGDTFKTAQSALGSENPTKKTNVFDSLTNRTQEVPDEMSVQYEAEELSGVRTARNLPELWI